eukprot:TRINITY_DN461_c0_g2_i1.p1 TRINITY_DN461_c0_g2~~TRINITY_DN461_c0_g2_i1.p1  ORF type:complete len:602 (+),score=129.57 TRINITY_DN461_c0_g2_i1:112-1917(+)
MKFGQVALSVTVFTISTLATAFEIQKTQSIDYEKLRSSVVRIQTVSGDFDWSQPFNPPADGVSLGTGFIVQTDPYLLFATNHHVIHDASQVTLQLLLYGEKQFDVDVVKSCPHFDLALLVLRNESAFLEAMASRDVTPQALTLSEKVAQMGDDAVALGFPLGQNSLKISKGNVAGSQVVNGNLCIQSTAPISPGNSGGPLLDKYATEVMGVNFAHATTGENINFVIPAWRLQQIVKQHLIDQPEKPPDGRFKRMSLRVPSHGLTTVEPNEEMYNTTGCHQGVYVGRRSETGFISNAKPEVQEGDMLVSVGGAELDQFGMTKFDKFSSDKVSFSDVFFMMPELSGEVEFETCRQGKRTRHTVSMQWKQEYNRGLPWVDEPNVEGLGKQYDQFGDIVVMQMTQNHVHHFMAKTGSLSLVRWLEPEFITQPRLMITDVRAGSYASDVLLPGSAVELVNGKKVRTLDEFRENLLPDGDKDVWTIETDKGVMVALPLKATVAEQTEKAKTSPHINTQGLSIIKEKMLARDAQKKSKVSLQKNDKTTVKDAPQKPDQKKNANSKQTSLLQEKKISIEIRAAGPAEVSKVSGSYVSRSHKVPSMSLPL